MRRHLLLVTATVVPAAGQPGLALVQADERLQEYRQALRHHVGELRRGVVSAIVFAENSGHDLRALAAEFPDPAIEWLAVPPSPPEAGVHRGHAEFALLSHVAACSTTLRDAAPDDVVWKVTGRYQLRNLARMVRTAPPGLSLYLQLSDHWAELSVLAWSVAGWSRWLEPVWPRFRTDMAPELILARDLHARQAAGEVEGLYTAWAWLPYLVGRRGSDGSRYEGRFGPLRHLWRLARWGLRRMRDQR